MKELPAYKRKIQANRERQEWPSYEEVQKHDRISSDLIIKYNCHPDCPHIYECVVCRMRCSPYLRRLWVLWQRGE